MIKIAAEQQEKLQKDREERMEQLKQIQAEAAAAKKEETAVPEEPKPEPKLDTEGVVEKPEPKPEVMEKKTEEAAPPPPEGETPSEEPRKRVRTGPLIQDTIIGKILIYHFLYQFF